MFKTSTALVEVTDNIVCNIDKGLFDKGSISRLEESL